MVFSESTAMMPTTRSPMRRAASSATGAPIEWPDEHHLLVVDLAHDRRNVLTEVAHRPLGAIRAGGAVAREVYDDRGVLRLERSRAAPPVVAVAGQAVDRAPPPARRSPTRGYSMCTPSADVTICGEPSTALRASARQSELRPPAFLPQATSAQQREGERGRAGTAVRAISCSPDRSATQGHRYGRIARILAAFGAQHLAGVHDSVGVEGPLRRRASSPTSRVARSAEPHLEPSDAVLGAETAAVTPHADREWRGGPRARAPRRLSGVAPGAWCRLKCRLPSPTCPYATSHPSARAIAPTAEARSTNSGSTAMGTADVVLETRAIEALRFENRLAQLPERVAMPLVLREHAIENDAARGARPSTPSSTADKRVDVARRGELAEHVPLVALIQRIEHAGDMLGREIDADPRNQLEETDSIAARIPQLAEQRDGSLRKLGTVRRPSPSRGSSDRN